MRTLFVSMSQSVKTGEPYYFLGVDVGYRVIRLTFDLNVIAEILGTSCSDVVERFKGQPFGYRIDIAEV